MGIYIVKSPLVMILESYPSFFRFELSFGLFIKNCCILCCLHESQHKLSGGEMKMSVIFRHLKIWSFIMSLPPHLVSSDFIVFSTNRLAYHNCPVQYRVHSKLYESRIEISKSVHVLDPYEHRGVTGSITRPT